MISLVIILYSVFFILLAHKNFRLAIGLFIIGLPTYLIRFRIGPLPSTLLELMFGILFLVWLIKFARTDWPRIKEQLTINKLFFIFAFLFFISSLISIFVSDMWYYSLGQWRAYFLEPAVVFVMLVGRVRSDKIMNNGTIEQWNNKPTPTDLVWFLSLSTISISVFGILQRFTGWHIGNVDWVALQTHRVTSFFLSPNAIALFLGPIVPLMAYQVYKNWANKKSSVFISTFGSIILALITLLLTKSLGAIIALTVGSLLFMYLVGFKKISATISVSSILLILALVAFGGPPPSSKVQSATNRLTLWTYTETFLTKSPKNFILGAGIRQFFRKIQKPYYDVRKMERLIYPHNIFLNFWTETGLLGMLSFAVICYLLFVNSCKIYKHQNKLLGATLLTTLTIFLIHGLIDVPYFKNDLSMLFWIIAGIIITSNETIEQLSNKKLNK